MIKSFSGWTGRRFAITHAQACAKRENRIYAVTYSSGTYGAAALDELATQRDVVVRCWPAGQGPFAESVK